MSMRTIAWIAAVSILSMSALIGCEKNPEPPKDLATQPRKDVETPTGEPGKGPSASGQMLEDTVDTPK